MLPHPIEHPGKHPDLGYGAVWGGIYIVNFMKRVAQNLRRVILLHFGLVIARFHSEKTRKLIMFMMFGFLDVSMIPKTNYS